MLALIVAAACVVSQPPMPPPEGQGWWVTDSCEVVLKTCGDLEVWDLDGVIRLPLGCSAKRPGIFIDTQAWETTKGKLAEAQAKYTKADDELKGLRITVTKVIKTQLTDKTKSIKDLRTVNGAFQICRKNLREYEAVLKEPPSNSWIWITLSGVVLSGASGYVGYLISEVD